MKIVVTGGAGFVGSHISVKLAQDGYNVIAVDNLERATASEKLRNAGIPLIVADIRIDDVPPADLYIHAAAYIDVLESWEKPYEFINNNTAATARLARRAGKMGARFIYISSAAVYGEPQYLPIDEEHPTRPQSPYGMSKLWGEQISALYVRKLTIVRPFNVYGPGQTGPYAGVITKFIERVKRGQPPIIYGDGKQTRDFIHVEDLADLLSLMVEKETEGVYNAGTGQPITIRELADLVIRTAGIDVEPTYAPPRPGDIRHSFANPTKAKKLGWEPRRRLETEIKKLLSS